jgi:hypothetical protein
MDDGRKDDCCLCEVCERHSVLLLQRCCAVVITAKMVGWSRVPSQSDLEKMRKGVQECIARGRKGEGYAISKRFLRWIDPLRRLMKIECAGVIPEWRLGKSYPL